LIVEDEQQVAYLFSEGQLRRSLAGPEASERLVRALGTRGHWIPMPRVAGYMLEGLCRLKGALDHTVVGPRDTPGEVGVAGEPAAARLLRDRHQQPGANQDARRGTP
jgi:hypothetical protein